MDSTLPQPLAGDAPAMDRSWGVGAAATVGLIFSLGVLLVYTFGVFVRPLSAEFGWSRTQLSLGVAVSQYTLALSSPFWGLLIDRFGPRFVVLPSVVCLSALVASLSLLTANIWHYYLVFAAISFTAGGATPVGYCAILVRRFQRHLGLALGLALMGVGIGAALLPPLSQALTANFGWRQAWAVLGALTLLVTFPAALIATRGLGRAAPQRPGFPAAAPGSVTPGSVMPLITSRTFVTMCFAFFLLGVISVGALTNVVPIMLSRGFSPQQAAQIAGLTGITAIIGRGGIGWVLDRSHPPYVVAAVALTALAASLLLVYGEGAALAYLAAILLGFVVGAEVDFTAFFVRYYFGNAVFGRLYGLCFGVFIVGSGTGPLLAGASFDRFGSYQPGALLFAAASALAVLLMFTMPARTPEAGLAAS